MLNKFSALALAAALSAGFAHSAFAADAATCEKQAVDKNGKALAGAAKTSFIKKCSGGEDAAKACEAKAIDKNGKPLAGAAKTASIKKCVADAK